MNLRAVDLVMSAPRAEADIIPLVQAQRDANCARGLPSVKKDGTRDKTVALVGYGPSLADTWAQLAYRAKDFDAIWTVSKAHDYLLKRGVRPTHHTDTDYRPHKVAYNRLWQDGTRYFMATQIHSTYLDALAGRDVSLFHVVQPGGGTFDNRYYKSEGSFDAGLQAAQLAYELSYRKQEWFGCDASMRGDKAHAGPHEGLTPEPLEIEIAGEPWLMSPLLVRQAMFCELMLRQRPKLTVKIHGDGALRPFLTDRGRCRVN